MVFDLLLLYVVSRLRDRIKIYALSLGLFPTSFFGFSCIWMSNSVFAQRLVVPNAEAATVASGNSGIGERGNSFETQILKMYPDGTKKIVPLSALNFRDDGAAFGGPPSLSVYSAASDSGGISANGLSVAPIGSASAPVTSSISAPQSLDPIGSATSSGDPMGGAAPADPLAGPVAPPLQTVSGKAAPVVGDQNSIQLGVWDAFFVNVGAGGSLQNQLTASRIWNGNNRQAYPYSVSGTLGDFNLNGIVTGENFTFQPGFRVDTEFGYNFYEWLGVSLQTGITYNGMQNYNISAAGDITIPGYGSLSGSGNFQLPADGCLIQVPVQINAIFRWPENLPFRPFLGLGLGTIWQELEVNSISLGPVTLPGNYSRSAFQFGWNAQLGMTYTVDPGVDFYGACKVLSAITPVIGNYEFQNSYNIGFEIGIQSRF